MRRFSLLTGLAVAFAVMSSAVDAQVQFGVQGSYIAGGFGSLSDAIDEIEDRDLSGDFGIGGRLAITPPALPLGGYAAVTYFFPSCEAADCSYWTADLGATLAVPLPVVRPYVVGGWQFKKYDLDLANFSSDVENNPFAGLGVQFNLGVSLFLEGVWEFEGDVLPGSTEELSITPFVIKGGVLFGS